MRIGSWFFRNWNLSLKKKLVNLSGHQNQVTSVSVVEFVVHFAFSPAWPIFQKSGLSVYLEK